MTDFFQTVFLLEAMLSGAPPIGEALSPGAEKLRFTARKGFAFPAGDITGLVESDDGTVQVEVAAMGLIGPSGVLPHWYHELVLDRGRANDLAMGAFYDLFHHRLCSLFYRAWKRNRLLAQKKIDNDDLFSSHLFSFLGLGTFGLRGRLASSEAALLFFSGQASRQTASAGIIAKIIGEVFEVATGIEQFVPRVVELERADRTRLGEANSGLGVDAVCGGEIWDTQSTFRLCLGPMGFAPFTELAAGPKLAHLVSLTTFMAGPEYEFAIRLVLKKEEVPPCRLGATTADAPRLGFSTWLKGPDGVLDADPFVVLHPTEVENRL